MTREPAGPAWPVILQWFMKRISSDKSDPGTRVCGSLSKIYLVTFRGWPLQPEACMRSSCTIYIGLSLFRSVVSMNCSNITLNEPQIGDGCSSLHQQLQITFHHFSIPFNLLSVIDSNTGYSYFEMIPLDVQLKPRHKRLKQIYASCKALCNQTLTHQLLESVGIDVSSIDVDTGATCRSVIPCFLPRLSFPSCRDITPLGNEAIDEITDYGQSRRNCDERNL